MWFGVVTLFPELIAAMGDHGVFGRARRSGHIVVESFNPRDHATNRHGTVDDKPYGGGPGMVMMAEPLLAAINEARAAASKACQTEAQVLLLSPAGKVFDQQTARNLAEHKALVLVCGRYEGVDQRVIDLAIDGELSVGDFVVSGGELPALLVMDAIARLAEGTIGNPDSLNFESHLDGLLEYPQYTRPENVASLRVPAVLLSGDHQAVAQWRRQAALVTTFDRRPDLLAGAGGLVSTQDRALLESALNARALDAQALEESVLEQRTLEERALQGRQDNKPIGS